MGLRVAESAEPTVDSDAPVVGRVSPPRSAALSCPPFLLYSVNVENVIAQFSNPISMLHSWNKFKPNFVL